MAPPPPPPPLLPPARRRLLYNKRHQVGERAVLPMLLTAVKTVAATGWDLHARFW